MAPDLRAARACKFLVSFNSLVLSLTAALFLSACGPGKPDAAKGPPGGMA